MDTVLSALRKRRPKQSGTVARKQERLRAATRNKAGIPIRTHVPDKSSAPDRTKRSFGQRNFLHTHGRPRSGRFRKYENGFPSDGPFRNMRTPYIVYYDTRPVGTGTRFPLEDPKTKGTHSAEAEKEKVRKNLRPPGIAPDRHSVTPNASDTGSSSVRPDRERRLCPCKHPASLARTVIARNAPRHTVPLVTARKANPGYASAGGVGPNVTLILSIRRPATASTLSFRSRYESRSPCRRKSFRISSIRPATVSASPLTSSR